jgi:hypothetical protein
MDCFLKKIVSGRTDDESHRYFIRFGKGEYARRFLISYQKGSKIKVKTSFELANNLVTFAKENGNSKFSGKILMREKVAGKEGKKKAGSFVYELSNASIEGFDNPYFYLLDSASEDIVLKMKKSLPKPGKDAEKIDDKFCSLEVNEKYWPQLKEAFFWDVPEGKKVSVEHKLIIKEIVFPAGEKDPVKIRELAKRKGIIQKKMVVDGKETVKEYPFEA